jgi:hypothetical protein
MTAKIEIGGRARSVAQIGADGLRKAERPGGREQSGHPRPTPEPARRTAPSELRARRGVREGSRAEHR